MTLNIIVLTPTAIYVSSDHRLTVGPPVKVVSNTSNKAVILTYGDWDGLVTYTGIGGWRGVDVSTRIAGWLAGIENPTPEAVAAILEDQTDKLIAEVRRDSRKHMRHTTTMTASTAFGTGIWVISNFQSADGRIGATPGDVSTSVKPGRAKRSTVFATGAARAFDRTARRQLERFADEHGDEPLRMRRRIHDVNEQVASSSLTEELVSPECQVISFRRDGSGAVDMGNPGAPAAHHLMNGIDTTALMRQFMADRFGIDPESVPPISVMAMGASNRPQLEARDCAVRWNRADALDVPALEIVAEGFAAMSAVGINDRGHVAGTGRSRPGEPQEIPWIWDGEHCTVLGFRGQAVGIDDADSVGTAWLDGPDEQVGFWDGETHTAVPVYKGQPGVFDGTGAALRDVCSDGRAVGLVRSKTEENGFANTRPAFFERGQPPRPLMDMSGPEGAEAMRINRRGEILVFVLERLGMASWLWNVETGTRELLAAADSGIVATALTDDGVVLGQTLGDSASRLTMIRERTGAWRPLGTPAGFIPTDINNAMTVVGNAQLGRALGRAWVHSAGETHWLPTVEHHHTSAARINEAGEILGFAGGDCEGHSLVWNRHDSPVHDTHV